MRAQWYHKVKHQTPLFTCVHGPHIHTLMHLIHRHINSFCNDLRNILSMVFVLVLKMILDLVLFGVARCF